MLEAVSQAVLSAPPPSQPPVQAGPMTTRFGSVAVEPERVVRIPHGLFGFAGRTRFVLTELPDRDVPFKLLQSVDDPELGFLVLPLVGEEPIRRRDLEIAGRRAGIAPDALVGLAIVTLRAVPGDVRCTVNLKAPILIDGERRVGMQHVLADERYDVRHPVALDGAAA